MNEVEAANFSVKEEKNEQKDFRFVVYPWDLIKTYKFNTDEKCYLALSFQQQQQVCHVLRKRK